MERRVEACKLLVDPAINGEQHYAKAGASGAPKVAALQRRADICKLLVDLQLVFLPMTPGLYKGIGLVMNDSYQYQCLDQRSICSAYMLIAAFMAVTHVYEPLVACCNAAK